MKFRKEKCAKGKCKRFWSGQWCWKCGRKMPDKAPGGPRAMRKKVKFPRLRNAIVEAAITEVRRFPALHAWDPLSVAVNRYNAALSSSRSGARRARAK